MTEGGTCIVLDDRPRHLSSIRSKIEEAGASPEIATLPAQFKRLFERMLKNPDGIRGVLLDNHLDDCEDLADLGHAEIGTDRGTTAGYRIASEILIPAIGRGEMPGLPIGIMSAHDVDQVRDEYEASGEERYKNIYFFKKSEVKLLEGESGAFFRALAPADRPGKVDPAAGGRDRACLAVATKFQQSFDLSDDDMMAIFSLCGAPGYEERVKLGSLSRDSTAWREMALVLVRVRSLLVNLYKRSANPDSSGALWLKRKRKGISEGSALAALKTGRVDRALQIVDELSISIDEPRAHE